MHQDVIIGFLLLLFCVLAFGITSTLPAVPGSLSQNLPPTFFPRIVLALISGLSLALIATSWGKGRRIKASVGSPVLITAGLITLSVALLDLLGMMISVILLMIALPLSWGERRIFRIVWQAGGVALAVYLIFSVALGIRFPAGFLATGTF